MKNVFPIKFGGILWEAVIVLLKFLVNLHYQKIELK